MSLLQRRLWSVFKLTPGECMRLVHEQSPGFPQVRRIEALSKPVADRGEQAVRLSQSPFIPPTAGEVRRGAQFPPLGALTTCQIHGLLQVTLCCYWVGCAAADHHSTFEPVQLCLKPA